MEWFSYLANSAAKLRENIVFFLVGVVLRPHSARGVREEWGRRRGLQTSLEAETGYHGGVSKDKRSLSQNEYYTKWKVGHERPESEEGDYYTQSEKLNTSARE